jgi:CP family cyanate transporter-like MFS transporter
MTASVSIGRLTGSLALLWLAGMALRLTILAVPPVLPLIHRDLALSETAIGTLGSLPALCFAFAAIPGSLLIARMGALRTLLVGLAVTALAAAARGASPDVAILFATTIAMAAGIAIMQPAVSPLVRDWAPDRVGFATAVYTNGLLVSEIVAVALTIPLVLPLVGGSWRLSLVVWALPILATLILFLLFAPRPVARPAIERAAVRWWPDWRDPLIWRLGIMFGSVNTIYWAGNSFLPDYLHAIGRPDLIGDALSAFNGGQLPASFLMLPLAGRLVRRHWAYVAVGAVTVACAIGMMVLSGAGIVWCAGLIGFFDGIVFVLLLALPPLLSAPGDVHRMSGAMFTISYPCAVVLQILAGYLWDVTGWAAIAFAPIALGGIAIMALVPGVDFRGAQAGLKNVSGG